MGLFNDAADVANEAEKKRQEEIEKRNRGPKINKKSAEDFVKGFNESPSSKFQRYKKRFKEIVGMDE